MWLMVVPVLIASLAVEGQTQGTCKEPTVEKRLLADDVRYASPFYVIALPRSSNTNLMDNVCYTYFETGNGAFFHIMSVTYKNGSNSFYTYNKGDISDRMGLAKATALSDSGCVFHDYTLTPICNATVFILYRCFIQGECGAIDFGMTSGVDARVVLAANPLVSKECRQETEKNLKDTSFFDGGDYVILPQKLKPQCVTKYNNSFSIGYQRAVGSKQVTVGDFSNRFATPSFKPEQTTSQKPNPGYWNPTTTGRTPQVTQPSSNKNSFNPYGITLKGSNNNQGAPLLPSQPSIQSGFTSSSAWTVNNGQWNAGPDPWNGQFTPDTNFHLWQSSMPPKSTMMKSPNVFYHIHSWENPPPGCCKCN